MANKKPEGKKKNKISLTLDERLLSKMDTYL